MQTLYRYVGFFIPRALINGLLQVSSSPFDDIVDEYDDFIDAEEGIITQDEVVAVRTSSVQVVTEGEARNQTGHIVSNFRKSLIGDAGSANLSVRTSVFSNRTSVTSKSSYESVRLDYSRLIDALDLEIDAHKCRDGCTVCLSTLRGFSVATIARSNTSAKYTAAVENGKKRVVSLPVVNTGLQTNHAVDDSAALLSAVHGSSAHRSPERLRRILGVPDTPERIGASIDNLLTYMKDSGELDDEMESLQASEPSRAVTHDSTDLLPTVLVFQPIGVAATKESAPMSDSSEGQEYPVLFQRYSRISRGHLWVGKVKERLNKIPRKAQQTRHHCVKSTKQFAMTVRHFLPGALAACYRS